MRTRHERTGNEPPKRRQTETGRSQRISGKKDFWDKVADDVADGYGARDAAQNFRNRDQEPNDNRRGDTAE